MTPLETKGSSDKQALQAIMRLYLAPIALQKGRLALIVIALVILSMALSLLVFTSKWLLPALFGDALSAVSSTPALNLQQILPSPLCSLNQGLCQTIITPALLSYLVPILLAGGGILRALANYLYQQNLAVLALEWARHYRESMFQLVLDLPYARLRARSPASWMSLIMNDVNFMQTRLSEAWTGLVKGGAQVLTCLVALLVIHWQSAVFLVVGAPLLAFGMGRIGRRIARYSEVFQSELAGLAATLLDLRARFAFIRAQHGEATESQRFADRNHRYFVAVSRSILLRSVFAPALEFSGFVLFAGFILGINAGLVSMAPGEMVSLIGAVALSLKPLRDLGEQLTRLSETRGAMHRSAKLFVELSAKEPSHNALVPRSGPAHFPIMIDKLEVSYDASATLTFTDLRLDRAMAVAIVGPSGAGKSTLAKSLAGLVQARVWQGNASPEQIQHMVTLVSQEPFFFHDSIAANLCYGLTNIPSHQEMWEALGEAGVAFDIKAMPYGLSTMITSIAGNISGGQLQRLTIARSLLQKKPILLFDEATSAIDSAAEGALLQRMIAYGRRQGTVFISVTHRLTHIGLFDEVWFVEDGGLIGRGHHHELLARSKRYQKFSSEI